MIFAAIVSLSFHMHLTRQNHLITCSLEKFYGISVEHTNMSKYAFELISHVSCFFYYSVLLFG